MNWMCLIDILGFFAVKNKSERKGIRRVNDAAISRRGFTNIDRFYGFNQ